MEGVLPICCFHLISVCLSPPSSANKLPFLMGKQFHVLQVVLTPTHIIQRSESDQIK